jgi:hypothetical protein
VAYLSWGTQGILRGTVFILKKEKKLGET